MTDFDKPDPLLTLSAILGIRGDPGKIELDTTAIRDITDEVMIDGRMQVLPAAYWATTTMPERALFGHRHGLYLFPTVELVDYLKARIAGRRAIEIGAGNGVLAEALGIRATDNFQQEMPKYREIYERTGQPIVNYGMNVQNMHASSAVRKYKPEVVIASWVTHKWDPASQAAGGNEIGIDEPDILLHTGEYIHIGDDFVHRLKPILNRPHTVEYPDFLSSRASSNGRQHIRTWIRPSSRRRA